MEDWSLTDWLWFPLKCSRRRCAIHLCRQACVQCEAYVYTSAVLVTTPVSNQDLKWLLKTVQLVSFGWQLWSHQKQKHAIYRVPKWKRLGACHWDWQGAAGSWTGGELGTKLVAMKSVHVDRGLLAGAGIWSWWTWSNTRQCLLWTTSPPFILRQSACAPWPAFLRCTSLARLWFLCSGSAVYMPNNDVYYGHLHWRES